MGKLAIRLANAVALPMVLKPSIELDIIFTATSEGACACISPTKIAARIFSENPDASVLLDRMLHLLASYDIPNCSKCIKENRELKERIVKYLHTSFMLS